MLNAKAKDFVPSFSSPATSRSSSVSPPPRSDSPLQLSPPQEINQAYIQTMIRNDTLIPFRDDEVYIDYEIALRYDQSISSISVKRWLTVDQVYQAKSGYGGRIGILPYYLDTNGRNYILNISNRRLYSDIGGGFNSKNAPYDGLIRELNQETPQWSEYLLDKLDDSNTNLSIYSTENIIATKQQLRLDIMIVMEVDASILSAFQPTKEVTELLIADDRKMKELFRTHSSQLNNGLRLIRSVYDQL